MYGIVLLPYFGYKVLVMMYSRDIYLNDLKFVKIASRVIKNAKIFARD